MSPTDQPTNSRRGLTIVKTLLTMAFIVAGVVFVAQRLPEIRALAWPSAIAAGAVVFGFVASVFFRSLYNFFVTRHLGTRLSLLESFMLSAVVTAGNAILPANPGATFRAVYMKKVHSFPYGYFASSTALSFVITALMMSVIGMALLVVINSQLGYFRMDIFIALPILSILMIAGLLLRTKSGTVEEKSVWSSFRSSYLNLVGDRQLVYLCISIVSTNFVIAACVWVTVLRDFSPHISVLEGFLFAASQIVSGLINLTPGAAGFQEIVGMYVGRSFEITAVELFAILIWVRMVRVVSAVILSIPCAFALNARTRYQD